MPIIIPISIFMFVVMGVVAVYLVFKSGPGGASERLRQLRNQDRKPVVLPKESPITRIAEKMAEPINRIIPPSASKVGIVRKRLMFAGFRSHHAPMNYRALQLLSVVVLPLATIFILMLIGRPFEGLAPWLLSGVFVGYLLPRKILDYMVERRQQELRYGLADALDLLVVSVEAGLGLNQAMVRVSSELKAVHPEISEEFDLVNTEIRIGREREEALRNLAERTGVDDLRGLCALLIQADRFGTSIARGIRVYSESMRTRRRQRAEQAAQKAAVKLLLPLAVFLFPTLFIALLGPAALQLMDAFGGR
jgi:tight adherence protein C